MFKVGKTMCKRHLIVTSWASELFAMTASYYGYCSY